MTLVRGEMSKWNSLELMEVRITCRWGGGHFWRSLRMLRWWRVEDDHWVPWNVLEFPFYFFFPFDFLFILYVYVFWTWVTFGPSRIFVRFSVYFNRMVYAWFNLFFKKYFKINPSEQNIYVTWECILLSWDKIV